MYIWEDARGHWHCIWHNTGLTSRNYGLHQDGGHSFSVTGHDPWYCIDGKGGHGLCTPDTPAPYNTTLWHTSADGSVMETVMGTRERPHMLFNEDGSPLALVTATRYCNGSGTALCASDVPPGYSDRSFTSVALLRQSSHKTDDDRGGAVHDAADDMDEPTIAAAGMHFEAPVTVGHHYFWANGMMGMAGGVALGQAEGSLFYTTSDSGTSWSPVMLTAPKAGGAAPLTEATVLSADGKTLHDISGVAKGSGDRTSINTSTSCFFTRLANGTFTAAVKARQVVFRGLPKPASNFRTDGRGYVKLADGSLLMSIILDWGIVAYTSSDGFHWDYVGTILDGADVPDSEEGPNENDLAVLSSGSIICIIRLDGGDGRKAAPPDMKAHHMLPYVKTVSNTGGKTILVKARQSDRHERVNHRLCPTTFAWPAWRRCRP